MKKLTGLLLSAALAASPSLARTDAETNLALGRHLQTIEDDARSERLVRGSLTLGLGAASTVGFFVARNASDPDVRDTLAPALAIAGGVFLLTGGLALAFPTEFERLPREYRAMAQGSADERKIRAHAGRDILRRLADKAKRDRYVGAGTLVAVGAAELIWYAASDRTTASRDYLIYGGLTALGLGAVTFFIPKTAEQEYEAFRTWERGTTAGLLPEVAPSLMGVSLRWGF